MNNDQLFTVVELLSSANKRPVADAADAYERKRRDIWHSTAHLLEIDLLCGGRRLSLVTPMPDTSYCIILSRVERRPQVEIWPVSLREAMPVVPVPLQPGDGDVPLGLTQALQRIYTSARYDLRINYRHDPPPPGLSPDDAAWLGARLQSAVYGRFPSE